MSARQQQRLGLRRLGRDRLPVDATPAPPVGETLQAARERKGVDLYRAERDTKIRLRYISALEDGDYAELPAPVYTKGFLRNYAIYLGLEPDDILERWRDEMEQQRTATRVAVIPPPMPMVEPGGRRLNITPSMIVAGLVGLVVIAFVGYIGIQLFRFADLSQPLPMTITSPPDVFFQTTAATIELAGDTGSLAQVHITGPADQIYDTNSNAAGGWHQLVNLAFGENDFIILATDPVSGRKSNNLTVTITVPLASPTPAGPATATPGPPVLLSLTLGTPIDGFVTSDPSVVVAGTTTGNSIRITSTYLGTPDSTPAPSSFPSASPASGSPAPSATPVPVGPAVTDVPVGSDGTFSQALNFATPGRWLLTVVSSGTGQAPVARQVTIVVNKAGPITHHLQLTIVTQPALIKVVADGSPVANETLNVGDAREFTATNQFCVKTNNAGSLHLVLDGTDLPLLGAAGEAGSWLIKPGIAPVRAARPC
ncbi:MAG: RodZ domain-containing protein [Chloroflexota bacterium]